MSKRVAEKYLTQENVDDEDGNMESRFTEASKEVLAKRKIKVPKSRLKGANSAAPKTAFKEFSFSVPGLPKLGNKEELMRHLKGLNVSFQKSLEEQMAKDSFADLSKLFDQYRKYQKSIQEKYGNGAFAETSKLPPKDLSKDEFAPTKSVFANVNFTPTSKPLVSSTPATNNFKFQVMPTADTTGNVKETFQSPTFCPPPQTPLFTAQNTSDQSYKSPFMAAENSVNRSAPLPVASQSGFNFVNSLTSFDSNSVKKSAIPSFAPSTSTPLFSPSKLNIRPFNAFQAHNGKSDSKVESVAKNIPADSMPNPVLLNTTGTGKPLAGVSENEPKSFFGFSSVKPFGFQIASSHSAGNESESKNDDYINLEHRSNQNVKEFNPLAPVAIFKPLLDQPVSNSLNLQGDVNKALDINVKGVLLTSNDTNNGKQKEKISSEFINHEIVKDSDVAPVGMFKPSFTGPISTDFKFRGNVNKTTETNAKGSMFTPTAAVSTLLPKPTTDEKKNMKSVEKELSEKNDKEIDLKANSITAPNPDPVISAAPASSAFSFGVAATSVTFGGIAPANPTVSFGSAFQASPPKPFVSFGAFETQPASSDDIVEGNVPITMPPSLLPSPSAIAGFAFGNIASVPEITPVQTEPQNEDAPPVQEPRSNDHLILRGPGEEDETTLYSQRAKILKGDDFKELGVGILKVNLHNSSHAMRFLCRSEGTGKVIINVALYNYMLVKQIGKRDVLIVAAENEGFVKYFFRLKDKKIADDLVAKVTEWTHKEDKE